MLGAILGAVGSLAGGFMQNSAAKKANKAQAAARQEDIALQREFAQNSLQWKAADAEKAGISKQFAMGAPSTSYAPVGLGSSSTNFGFMESAGQNIGRAITAAQDPTNQAGAIPRAAQALQLESIKLDNDIKRTQLASLNKTLLQPGQPPGVPNPGAPYGIPGQPLTLNPPELEQKTKIDVMGDQGVTPYATPENMPVRTASGKTTMMLAPATQEALESMGWLAQRQAEMRNIVYPWLFNSHRPESLRDSDKHVSSYNPLTGEYTLYPKKPLGSYRRYK